MATIFEADAAGQGATLSLEQRVARLEGAIWPASYPALWSAAVAPAMPPPLTPFGELGEAKAQLGKLARELAAAKAEIEAMKQDRAHEARRLQIEAFEAETNRLRALQK